MKAVKPWVILYSHPLDPEVAEHAVHGTTHYEWVFIPIWSSEGASHV
jgi:hypothetical protein